MGRRKIEIKAIKDDRNRSVTFLKRKGGLFKKAHELSVLCSVDVAVIIFSNNHKKLYQYSSTDMRNMVQQQTYHAGPTEHKGPSDFNGGNDDDDDEEDRGTPPQHGGRDSTEPHYMPPHLNNHFPVVRQHTPSASPPIPNGVFPRTHTPQPMGSRPGSRNDMRRGVPPMVPPPQGNGYYMPGPPAMYSNGAPPIPGQPYPFQNNPQQYLEDQRRSMPPYESMAQPPPPPPPSNMHMMGRPTPSPQPANSLLPPQQAQSSLSVPGSQPPPYASPVPQPAQMLAPPPVPHMIPHTSPQQFNQHLPPQNEAGPAEGEGEMRASGRMEAPKRPILDTGLAKKGVFPKRYQGTSLFTPIDDQRSVLAQHLDALTKAAEANTAAPASMVERMSVSPPSRLSQEEKPGDDSQGSTKRPTVPPISTMTRPNVPETTFTPPSRSNGMNSVNVTTPGGASRPRLKVQIPVGESDGSASGTSQSPRTATGTHPPGLRRPGSDPTTINVLPPPSPSASALLSAGASGPPNPFAGPMRAPASALKIDTPSGSLPSRMMFGDNILPSPSTFWAAQTQDNWGNRDNSNMLSPLNFNTPLTTSGPSFLRDEGSAGLLGKGKRKSPEVVGETQELKRVKVE